MLHSANSRHDGEAACPVEATTTTAVYAGEPGLFPAASGLASTWSYLPPPMDRSSYGCYDPPSTPAVAFLSPPPPPGVYRPAIGELRRYRPPPPPPRPLDVDATPPYFVGDRHHPVDVLDPATSRIYGGGMYRGDVRLGAGAGLDAAALMAGGGSDALRRTPSVLTPPPSMFAWRGAQTNSFSSSMTDHDPVRCRFQSYYSNSAVDMPSCRSPVGADRKFVVIYDIQHFSSI